MLTHCVLRVCSVVSDSLRPPRLLSPWDYHARIGEWVAIPFSIVVWICIFLMISGIGPSLCWEILITDSIPFLVIGVFTLFISL